MRLFRRISPMFVLLTIVLAVWSEPVAALSCAGPRGVAEEFAASSVVFYGEALEQRGTEHGPETSFRVIAAWKGAEAPMIRVHLSDMWLVPRQGSEYLIYAAERDGVLWANICGRSSEWSKASADADQFGIPAALYAIPPEQPDDTPYWIAGTVVVLALLIIALYALSQLSVRQRKRLALLAAAIVAIVLLAVMGLRSFSKVAEVPQGNCQCEPIDLEGTLADSNAIIFEGTVIGIRRSLTGKFTVTVIPQTLWRGKAPQHHLAMKLVANCPYPFERDARYTFVFSQHIPRELAACSTVFSENSRVLDILQQQQQGHR